MEIQIKRAEIKDIKALIEVEKECFDANNSPLNARSFRYHIAKNLLLIAQNIDDEILGYILVLTKPKIARIYSLGVGIKWRSYGVGAALLSQVCQSFNSLKLEVRTDNKKAIKLYEKFGFITCSVLPRYYDDGADALKMIFNQS